MARSCDGAGRTRRFRRARQDQSGWRRALLSDVPVAAVRWHTALELEWPPRSVRREAFLKLDRVAWFDLATANTKIVQGQIALLDRLADARNVHDLDQGT